MNKHIIIIKLCNEYIKKLQILLKTHHLQTVNSHVFERKENQDRDFNRDDDKSQNFRQKRIEKLGNNKHI